MAVLTTGDGSLDVPDFVINAVARNAEFRAELTAAFLNAAGLVGKSHDGHVRSCGLSADALLELGFVLQLAYWELHGLRSHLPEELPRVGEAATSLAKRAAERASGGEFRRSEELSNQVFGVWWRRFAWNGRELLQADVVLGDIDEDQLIDVMAKFLWDHRHDIQQDSDKTANIR